MKNKYARFSLTAVLVLMLAAMLAGTALANTPVTGAAFTTVNETVDGTGHCQNGNPNVNCNIYDGKQFVWLNGGPSVAYVGDGQYFFAVLAPGGQADPNDGGAKNLSDTTAAPWSGGEINSDSSLVPSGDLYGNRTFTVTNGVVSYGGSHDFSDNKVRLMPYDDTTNPGGVYILAICSLADGYPVNPSDCKYDAFKVKTGEGTGPEAPTIIKDANGTYDNTFGWTIEKHADKTIVKQIGGSATFTYYVTVSHDGGTIGNVVVAGTITVSNYNVDNITGAEVTDQLSDGTICTVTGGSNATLAPGDNEFPYTCSLSGLPQGNLDNTAMVTWPTQMLSNGQLDGGSDDFTFTGISFAENKVDECVNVTDTYAGTLGTVCVGDANPKTFSYQRTIAIPANGCLSYDNTATFTTNDTGTFGSDGETVQVCGPAKTGALTIGFWKTTNGQGLIKTYCNNSGNNLGTYLKGLGAGVGPFSDAPTSCSSLATYVSNVLKGASATDMNKMLKAQMMGTSLDVWFSGPGWTSTTVNKIKPPSNFLSHNNLGSFNMDTTVICPMVDNTTAGTASCKNGLPSTNAFASGAVPSSPMSMQAILNYAATTPAPFNGSTSSSIWYAGNRTLQEVLKNIYDQFNNQQAFGSF